MDKDRIQREKEYHNIAFSGGIRKSADKFYTIHKFSFAMLSAEMLDFCRGKKILEYGCGPGSHSFILAQSAALVTSIDISDFAIKEAQEKAANEGINNISFKEMNAEALDFDDDSFDMVYGNAIIHHLDLKKAYTEVNRVLKKGGRAYFYEPLGHNFFINLYRKFTPRMRTIDEHPLLMQDIHFTKSFFDNVNVRFFHLTTLMCVPLRNLKAYDAIIKFFHKTDKVLFRLFPFLKRYAWYCIIEIKKDTVA